MPEPLGSGDVPKSAGPSIPLDVQNHVSFVPMSDLRWGSFAMRNVPFAQPNGRMFGLEAIMNAGLRTLEFHRREVAV
jgi:hypothetical protein